MQADKSKPADTDRKHVQADAQSDAEFARRGGAPPDLQKASEDLKARIAEAKRRNDLPVNSALGNPGWERSVADGHLDVPDKGDDD